MKTFTLAALLALGFVPAARAEKFTCSFTEPFYTITYDTSTQKLLSRNDSMETSKTYRNVSFQIVGAGEFRLSDSRGKELLSMKLTQEGSDGMSDIIYPFDAKTDELLGGANNGWGGCESSLLKNREGQH